MLHKKRANGKGGYSHLLASTLFLRAVGPATVLSHKCDIPSFWKDDQILRDNRLPVHCRRLESRRHRTVISVATQMSPCLLTYPLFKCAQHKSVAEFGGQFFLCEGGRSQGFSNLPLLRQGPKWLVTGALVPSQVLPKGCLGEGQRRSH